MMTRCKCWTMASSGGRCGLLEGWSVSWLVVWCLLACLLAWWLLRSGACLLAFSFFSQSRGNQKQKNCLLDYLLGVCSPGCLMLAIAAAVWFVWLAVWLVGWIGSEVWLCLVGSLAN